MQLLSSSNKLVSIDRLSELPDSLRIHILSFLNVKQAAVTSVLSKRWQFLWSDLPRLEFVESNMLYWDINRDREGIRRFVSWVNKTLAVRTVNYLESFGVWFQYSGCYSSDVDAWVEFALKNKAKNLCLMLNSYKDYYTQDYYTLPDAMYSNSLVVSMMVVNEWQLPQSARRCLVVNAASDYEHSFSGIIGLLESSPDLESLVIADDDADSDFVDSDSGPKGDLSHDLPKLKTVTIRNFVHPNGEPMLTLARILLKRAPVLEKMVIAIDVELVDDLYYIGQALLACPRSSPKAVVLLQR